METETEEQFVEDVQQQTSGLEQQGTQQTKEVTEPAPITQTSLDAAFEKLGSAITKAVTPREQQQASAQMSEQEKAELWAIYDPEKTQKDFMRKWFRLNPEATEQDVTEARAMWKNMQEGLVKQAVVGSRNLMTIELQKMQERYAPLEAYYREAQAEKLQKEFFTAYPSLGEVNEAGSPKFMKAIHVAANDLANQNFPDRPTYFKALAERASEFVKGILPDFDLGKAATKAKPSTSTPRLPRTGVGGSGGTSRDGTNNGDTKATRGANGDDASTLDWTAST